MELGKGAGLGAGRTRAVSIDPRFYIVIRCMIYMGMGMLGIFVVIGSIILVTLALNKFTSGKAK